MSYWFAEPHTLVLAGAQIDLRDPRERDRLGENRKPLSPSALYSPMFLAVRTEILLRLQPDIGSSRSKFVARKMPRNRSLIRWFCRHASPARCRGI
jgi:hypothetical protein